MPINPKTHFGLLLEHVDALIAVYESTDGVTETALHELLGGGGETEGTRADIRQLADARIIEERPGKVQAWQIAPATRNYMAHVLQRGTMNSPESVTAMVRDARRRVGVASALLGEGRVPEGVDELRDVINLVDAFRISSEQLGEVVVGRVAKLKGLKMDVQERFQRIRRMWDDIVLPLYEHVSPDGTIETTMQEVATLVEEILVYSPHSDAVIQAGTLAGAVARARRSASRSFNEAYSEVIRLYEDPRTRERIEIGVEILLNRILADGITSLDLPKTMPITAFRMSNLMNDEAAARIVHGMAEAGDNEPEPLYDASLLTSTDISRRDPIAVPANEDAMGAIVAVAVAEGRPVVDVIEAYRRIMATGVRNRHHQGKRAAYQLGGVAIEAPVLKLSEGV